MVSVMKYVKVDNLALNVGGEAEGIKTFNKL